MWYGGQGDDGHDRILYAESRDGLTWERKGVAVQDQSANHVNDPTVVKVGETYFMYFTRAGTDVIDEIALATSRDGRRWEQRGVVLTHGEKESWDALSVGRPSVMYDAGVFKMWYDGRKDLPLGSPASGVPKAAESTRSVGYATSHDGLHWKKYAANPVFGHNAGGIGVTKFRDKYLMVYESPDGTRLAVSDDGVKWIDYGVWVRRSGQPLDAFGHVTPFLNIDSLNRKATLYFGAAANARWDHNSIAAISIPFDHMEKLITCPSP